MGGYGGRRQLEEIMDKDMISIVWTQDLAVEREDIDDQHRHLFKLLADFYTQLQKGAGREVMGRTLEDLMSYAGEHFAIEEMYLQEHPDFARHRQLHYSFIKKMNAFERSYLHGDIALGVEMVDFVRRWLCEHIAGTDRRQFADLHKERL